MVELRYFGGLSIEETAEVLGVGKATVNRSWRVAKAWLYKELSAQKLISDFFYIFANNFFNIFHRIDFSKYAE